MPTVTSPASASPATTGSATPAVDAESVARLRATIGRLARQMRVSAAGSGLTATQISVLGSVVRHGPLRLADLAAIEAVNPTMLSRIIGKLEDAGLISRTCDPADRRVITVEVTAAGRRIQQSIRDERDRALTVLLDGLPPHQAQAVLDALPALEALSLGLPR